MNKFKVFLVLLVAILLIFVAANCTSCGGASNIGYNKQLIDFNYKFTNAYVKIGDSWVNVQIKAWKDYDDGEQLQIVLEDDPVLLVSSYNCILYVGQLPAHQ